MERFIKMAIMQETEDEKFNVSINIIGTESPEPAVTRARPVHSRSNSDVTPRCVCIPPAPPPVPPPPPPALPHPRSRSLGARPSHKHKQQALSLRKTSVSHLAVDFSPHLEISTLSSILAKCEKKKSPVCSPRKIRSEQTSPSVSVISIPEAAPAPAADKAASQLVYIPSDPWTKQTESNVKNVKKLTRTNHLSLECSPADNGPWVLNSASRGCSQSQRQLYRKTKSFSKQKSIADNRKSDGVSSNLQVTNLAVRRNSKLERLSPVSCNVCWSTDTCKCFKTEDNLNLNIPLSPASLNVSSPDFPPPSRSSPIRLTAAKQIPVKKSPVTVKRLSRESPVSGIKCLHDLELSGANGKVEMVCTCNALKQISPRPSPRKSLPRSDYLSPKENETESSDPSSRKSSISKVAPVTNAHPETSDNPSQKVNNCDVTRTQVKEVEPISTCDPLLETTC